MTFREILQALWRRRRLLVISAAVSIILGLALVIVQGRSYRAQTQVLLNQQSVYAPGGDGLLTLQKLNLAVLTYARQASSNAFVQAALANTNIGLKNVSVDAQPIPNTPIVEITVTSTSGARAAAAARTVADALREEIAQSQSELPEELAVTTEMLQDPRAEFVSADPFFAVMVALIAGLALAATAALIIESE